jgi:aromatic-L-amino-acid decarboxylase
MDIAGIGAGHLRRIPVDERQRMRLDALEEAIRKDREAGLQPFAVVGSAGTVDVGAIDDLSGLADIAQAHGLHFHVDGAIGALAVLSPRLAPRFKGIERADSIAFDWHKWGQAPYDAGFLLVRDGELQRRTFSNAAIYLKRRARGLGGGDWWPSDYGPDLSRSFRALKVWFMVEAYGTAALARIIEKDCEVAEALGARIEAEPALELLSPVQLNVVCFRHRGADPDALNDEIVARLHESGAAAPSETEVGGRTAIRAAIVNHRTTVADGQALVDQVLALGREILAETVA